MRRVGRALAALIGGATILAAATGLFAPYVYSELTPWRKSYDLVSKAPAKLAKGRMFDSYFAVEDLGADTYAIGEPRYYQANYAYLIVGRKRALLFDAGSGTRDMRPVVASLTSLPVTVLPSHLHYDHLAGASVFERLALPDEPGIRAEMADGRFTPGRYEFLGMFDGLKTPSLRVSEWIKPGQEIDLGGRSLTLLATPGHTPNSVALYDQKARRLFSGDFIYPTMLYGFLPGASLSAYRQTASRLKAELPRDTVIWSAHCCRRGEGFAAPWLTMRDVDDLASSLTRIQDERSDSVGFFPRRFPVNAQMEFAAGFPWNNR